jgi:hypothetical protein
MPWRRMGGEEVVLLLILNLGTRWGWVVSITPRHALLPGKWPRVPIGQEAGWAPEPVWTQGLEEKSSASVGDRTPFVQFVVRYYTDWATPAPLSFTPLVINYYNVYTIEASLKYFIIQAVFSFSLLFSVIIKDLMESLFSFEDWFYTSVTIFNYSVIY